MALPPNYKQLALQMPSGPQTPNHMLAAGSPMTFNILKERLKASGSSSAKETNPFVSGNGNPGFVPQKVGKNAVNDPKQLKPPKAPEKPAMPYLRYSKKVWDTVKAQNPDLKLWEIGKIIGQMWRDLPDEQKQEYVEEYENDKVEYEKALKSYHNSQPYLNFIAAKNKSKSTQGADGDTHERRESSKQAAERDRRIEIQPAEDDEDQDDGFSVKHVAYARYLRNHRLINEIFSETVVPDVRSVITTGRLQVLKRQVQSLTMHQKKLEAELQQIEEKFEAKKQKFMESSQSFQEELKKHCKPAVDEDTFQKMVERQYELLKKEKMKALEEQSKPKTEDLSNGTEVSSPEAATLNGHQEDSQEKSEPMETEKEEIQPPTKTETPEESQPLPRALNGNPIPRIPSPRTRIEQTLPEKPPQNAMPPPNHAPPSPYSQPHPEASQQPNPSGPPEHQQSSINIPPQAPNHPTSIMVPAGHNTIAHHPAPQAPHKALPGMPPSGPGLPHIGPNNTPPMGQSASSPGSGALPPQQPSQIMPPYQQFQGAPPPAQSIPLPPRPPHHPYGYGPPPQQGYSPQYPPPGQYPPYYGHPQAPYHAYQQHVGGPRPPHHYPPHGPPVEGQQIGPVPPHGDNQAAGPPPHGYGGVPPVQHMPPVPPQEDRPHHEDSKRSENEDSSEEKRGE